MCKCDLKSRKRTADHCERCRGVGLCVLRAGMRHEEAEAP